MIKINFNNERDGKLYFYEKIINGLVVEFAWLSAQSKDITYKTEEGDINKWPKSSLPDFLNNLYNKIAMDYFGSRVDLKSKSSQPYFGLKISGSEITLIHFFIANLGLIETLKFFGIEYQFSSKRNNSAFLNLKIIDPTSKYFSIFTKTLKEEYIIGGLKIGSNLVFPVQKEELKSPDLYNPYFEIKGANGRYVKNIREAKQSFIDNTTIKILKMYNIPTDIMDLFGKFIPDYLLNADVDNIEDLSNQRIRMAEAISHAGYKMIQQATSSLKKNKESGSGFSAKLELHPYFIIREMDGSGMFQFTQTTNPLEELLLSSKITKTGIGNMKKEQVTLQKRDLNQSYFGTVAATTTNEYAGIGLNQTLTNKATIKDRFGSIDIKTFDNNRNPFENLSATESLLPFYEYDDTTRRVMGNQQFSQFIQLDNPDEPLVQTGFESIVPHLVSDRFAIKAKETGQVKKITPTDIEILDKKGTLIKYSIKDKRSRTKRGIYMPLKYNILVKDGQKVAKGDIIAATNSLKTGKLAVGKNLVVALMSYRGMNYEDGWVVTDAISQKYTNTIYEKVTILVPIGAKIKDYNLNLNSETKPGEILISYYKDTEFDIESLVNEDEDDSTDLLSGVEYSGNQIKYRSPGGKIKDIIIKLNNKNVDNIILEKWNTATKDIRDRLEECQLLKHDHKAFVDCTSNIDNTEMLVTRGHKVNGHEFEGAVIEIFLEGQNPIRSGSKFTLGGSGGKGTIQYTIPKGQEPKSEITGLDIEFIPTPVSIISRKNPSILLIMYSGKVIYYLNKKVKELIGSKKIQEARKLLMEVLGYMDSSPDQFIISQLMGFFDGKSDNEIIKYVQKSDPLTQPAFPLLVPPHKNKINIRDIENAARALNIPLDEKVFIPEEGIMTDRPVPVGIISVFYLEHFPKAMSSSRGSLKIKHQFTTGQGRSGTKEGNGAMKLGLYDLFAISYQTPALMIKELYGLKSDNNDAKFKLRKLILKGGEMPEVKDIKIDSSTESKTRQLVEAYFRGALLEATL